MRAGEKGLEPPTTGFGDRGPTNWTTPLSDDLAKRHIVIGALQRNAPSYLGKITL